MVVTGSKLKVDETTTLESTIRKKIAAVHFTTDNLANLIEPLAHTEGHILAKFIPVLTTL